MPVRTHLTAVAIVPPDEVWSPLQIIRRQHDPNVGLWMPHVALLHPFHDAADLPAAAATLRAVCRPMAPFPLRYRAFKALALPEGKWGIALDLEPRRRLVEVQLALWHAFPDCDELNRFPAGYHPHLTVGQVDDEQTATALAAELQQTWRPITCLLQHLAILHRTDETRFNVAERIPLGDAIV